MTILSQFLLRLAFGLAFGMAITSPRLVSSGYFRNHLYVTLGLATLAAVAIRAASPEAFWYAVGAAVASYVGAVCWLYEKKIAGRVALIFVALTSITGALVLINPLPVPVSDREKSFEITSNEPANRSLPTIPSERAGDRISLARSLRTLSSVSSGLLLGMTTAAMLLGHWYLNAPGMELAPLRQLIAAALAAVVAQSLVCGSGLMMELALRADAPLAWLLFVTLRWSFGLFGVAGLLWMARKTLEIPNTQSATGILYVAVIGVFVGELTAALLSAESTYPL
jgi:hypothetical protein